MKKYFLILLSITFSCFSQAQKKEKLIHGAAFIDRFLPIKSSKLSSNTWGAKGVIPRDIANGIEDSEYSYWGGNIVKGDDGKFHMFVARWKESNTKQNGKKSGHRTWWSSEVAHAVSTKAIGPYKVVDVIGKGHNPEIYRLQDKSYIIGVMGKKAYKSTSINGPWTEIETTFKFKNIDAYHNVTNRTYIIQEDGSTLMMNKTGVLFTAEKGNEEHFTELDVPKAYRRSKGGLEEDPVIWKDEVQYNLIVNDAYGRKAKHLTSLDGIHNWTFQEGIAYDPNIVNHTDQTQEKWYKLERPKVLLDKYGRVTHMNFAAIDTIKNNDLANDNHSSKNVIVPLVVQKRLELLNAKKITKSTKEIKVKILAEEGFNPHKDIDCESLRFGISTKVNRGLGAKLVTKKKVGKDLILIFNAQDIDINKEAYVAKLLGATKNKEILFGYVKIP